MTDHFGTEIPKPARIHADSISLEALQQSTSGHDLDVFDSRLLDALAQDLLTAHSINPKSWSLYLAAGRVLTLAVSHLAVFWLVGNDNGFWLKGDLDDERFESLRKSVPKTQAFRPSNGFKVSGMKPDRCAELIQEFASNHLEAVSDLARAVKTHGHWHLQHQSLLVEQLAQVVGRDLPNPEYPYGSSSQKLPHNLDNTAIAKMLDGMDKEILEQLARDIEIAHEVNVNSWALMRPAGDQGVVMFVGRTNTCWIREDGGGWLFAGQAQDQGFSDIDPARMQTDYADLEGFWIGVQSQKELLSTVRTSEIAHEQAVRDLAGKVRTRTPRASKHELDVLIALEQVLGRQLPHPSYETEEAMRRTLENVGVSEAVFGIDSLSTIIDQFATSGLHYTEAQIATFYTSLQTKGFVVLSGISGTGKSKIATGFVDMLPAPALMPVPSSDITGMIPISVKPYMRTYKRVVLPARQVDLLPPLDVGQQIEVAITVDGIQGTGRLEHRPHTGESSITVLYFRGELGKAFANLDIGTKLYLKPTLDEDGDSIERMELLREGEIAHESAASLSTNSASTENHLFLSVRPDWRDSTSLLGYYNPLTQTYEWTEFLRFLLQAQASFEANDGLAWFVILDEMNLAHVEYYFADLLSVIESGRDDDGWTREPLRLTYPDTLEDEAPPHELRLPPNLYIIGTVNMDETTHAFSPKVLDRAFTIELADVDFTDYPIVSDRSAAAKLTDDEKTALLRAFTRFDPETGNARFALIDKDDVQAIVAKYPAIRDDLQALNGLLQQNRMHFGYRVFDEIAQYLYNNDRNGMMPFEAAFDQAVFMKVLPKFTGSRARLQSPLRKVLAWAIDPGKTTAADIDATVQEFIAYERGIDTEAWEWPLDARFPTVAARVRDMLVALERDGFVSFG